MNEERIGGSIVAQASACRCEGSLHGMVFVSVSTVSAVRKVTQEFRWAASACDE